MSSMYAYRTNQTNNRNCQFSVCQGKRFSFLGEKRLPVRIWRLYCHRDPWHWPWQVTWLHHWYVDVAFNKHGTQFQFSSVHIEGGNCQEVCVLWMVREIASFSTSSLHQRHQGLEKAGLAQIQLWREEKCPKSTSLYLVFPPLSPSWSPEWVPHC